MVPPIPHPGKLLPRLLPLVGIVLACLLGLRLLDAWGVFTPAPVPPQEPLPDALGARGIHLGVALVPAATPPSRAHIYEWHVDSLEPSEYRVGYGLSESMAASLENAHRDYGRRMHFRALSPSRFTYRAPPECQKDMRCIYAELMRSNAEPVRVLGDRFAEHIRTWHLDSVAAAELIITFVQSIHYAPPAGEPFGILPPALVAARDEGDCDSKALLAVMLLRQVGIDAVILYSDPLAHAAVGVVLPVRGPPFRLGGQVYRYAEITTEGWLLGMVPPQYDKPHLWNVLPLPELPGGGEG